MLELILIVLFNTLIYSVILSLISVGLNMILGVLKILNVAHGVFFALGAYFSVSFVRLFLSWGVPTPLIYLALLIGGIVAGIVTGLIVEPTLLRRIYKRVEVHQLLVTFALMLIIEDLIKFIWGPQSQVISEPYLYLGVISVWGITYPAYYLFLCGVGAVILLGTYVLLNKTKLGKIIHATAFDREISLALGMDVNKVYTYSFIIGTTLTTLGGSLMAPTLSLQPGFSSEFIVIAFAVIVIGGLGSIKGAFLTSIIISFARSLTVVLFPELELALLFIIMVIVLLIKPYGLFGGR